MYGGSARGWVVERVGIRVFCGTKQSFFDK